DTTTRAAKDLAGFFLRDGRFHPGEFQLPRFGCLLGHCLAAHDFGEHQTPRQASSASKRGKSFG
ncbi:MAG: hypothetical protein ACK5D7_10680, partial [Planctomycetota bacterium]